MLRPKGDIDRGAWFDFWYGSEPEWSRWHDRTEPTSLPGEKRRQVVYAVVMACIAIGYGIGFMFS